MQEPAHLKKTLGFTDVFSLASGAMISSGIFILPALAFANVGPAMFISYLIAGILAVLGALSTIELATAMPKAGGDYYFIERSMGPLVGTISGLLSYFALCLKSSFAILGLAQVTLLMTGLSPTGSMHWDIFILGSAFIGFFCLLNIFGVKEAAKLEVLMVAGLLLLLGFFVVAGIGKVKIPNFEPFVKSGGGFTSILAVSGLVFVSFGGVAQYLQRGRGDPQSRTQYQTRDAQLDCRGQLAVCSDRHRDGRGNGR